VLDFVAKKGKGGAAHLPKEMGAEWKSGGNSAGKRVSTAAPKKKFKQHGGVSERGSTRGKRNGKKVRGTPL